MLSGVSSDTPPSNAIDTDAVVVYISNILQAMLQKQTQGPLLLDKEKMTRFATDPVAQVIYITADETTADEAKWVVEQEPKPQGACVALIKRYPVIENTRPLQEQLLMINIPDVTEGSNQFAVFQRYLQYAFSPLFDSGHASKDDKDVRLGLSFAKKKMAELELSLAQLQHSVAIPDITLRIHPYIQKYLDDCRASGTAPVVEGLGNAANDSVFLNKLQNDVNGWIKEIQKVTKLDRDPHSGSARQEIEFWLALERALNQVSEQLRAEEITLSLDVLRSAKRYLATVSFLADTGIKEAMEKVQRYNQLMKEFPINELLSSPDLEKVREAIFMIFTHFNKKLKLSPYPIHRALPLVEAISRDLNQQLIKILGEKNMMALPWTEFEHCMSLVAQVFATWDDNVKEFVNVARESSRKRSEKFIPIKINPEHSLLQERLNFVHGFRRQHEQLCLTIAKVIHTESLKSSDDGTKLKSSDFDNAAQQNVQAAFEEVRNVDVLDLSQEGTDYWVLAESKYNNRIAQVENQIIIRLKDRLAMAKSANDMFRVFSKFNALFIRPKIRGAIHEYQKQLIDRVKEDISKLHEKFVTQHSNSEALQIIRGRDLLPISSSIVWAKQIERQLSLYMSRVEDVLGRGWEQYAEGQKLSQEETAFKRQLDPTAMFDRWIADVTQRDLSISGRVFDISRNRLRGNELQLGVNFDPQSIAVFKEVRNLLWLKFPVPHTIVSIAKDAKRVYPYAVSLNETVRAYVKTLHCISEKPSIQWLLSKYHSDVQAIVSENNRLRWEQVVNSYDVHVSSSFSNAKQFTFVSDLALTVSIFEEKTLMAVEICERIETHVRELATVPYNRESLEGAMTHIQQQVDQLNKESFSNLSAWTKRLNSQIEATLLLRLKDALQIWVSGEYYRIPNDVSISELQYKPPKALKHEICFKNQSLYLNPPLENARMMWIQQMHNWFGVVTNLRRPRVFQLGMTYSGKDLGNAQDFQTIIPKLGFDGLQKAYGVVNSMYATVSSYVSDWLSYQSLWDLEPSALFERLGENLDDWGKTLVEMKKARATFDTTMSCKVFPGIIIDYEHIQTKVNAQYDQWQRDVLHRYGLKIGAAMKSFHATICTARLEIEKCSPGTSTNDMVKFLLFVRDLQEKQTEWSTRVNIYQQGQRILERNRFFFPLDWLYFDQINGDWSAFCEILSRKMRLIQDRMDSLREKIDDHDGVSTKAMKEILSDWDRQKPVTGNMKPFNAIAVINTFNHKFNVAKVDFDQLVLAKKALGISAPTKDYLENAFEELRDLKGIWESLSDIWDSMHEIEDTLWFSEASWTVRQRLETLSQRLKDLPSRMRQYAPYDYTQSFILANMSIHVNVARLKSDALRDRHWDKLLVLLGLQSKNHSNLTVGNIWTAPSFKQNEKSIEEVLVLAQGELALEEFLRQVKLTWSGYSLEFTTYQNKCRLVKGWDDMFTKCEDHLAALGAMRHSQYFKIFEDETAAIQDRLTRLHLLLDSWIVVQRQWVYLEGIFSGNQDIKQILPIESNRFVSINAEFMSMLRKVYKSPLVMDVIAIPNIQRSMERLSDMLNGIQKSLGEYLEKERSKFPRFYFVGDEDLLEILGNSKDILRIQPHFKKMFAGIHTVLLSDDSTEISSVCSKEGEVVVLKTPVSIVPNIRVNEWLVSLENETKSTLLQNLAESYESKGCDYLRVATSESYLSTWMDLYPTQIVLLTAEVKWTEVIEKCFLGKPEECVDNLKNVATMVDGCINILAKLVLTDMDVIRRKKCEGLITELVHQRDVTRQMVHKQVTIATDFEWLATMRFYLTGKIASDALTVRMANASFTYGFEYLGIQDRLVQTPLTDRCYLTLSQALHNRLGGNPFGPAGTGKTESVKAMGAQLGRLVLVFCCDENFDFQSMGRIFTGLCQVGAWGCFDEFNRLDERILSAVSQQIQTIQMGLKSHTEVELVNKSLIVHRDTGIFITMNLGYAGRSNLPDNLRKLFRSVAMSVPDRLLISQVMLFSQGFCHAEVLASKTIPFFDICKEQLSSKSHYDFGLRALKSVLVSAGNLQRCRMTENKTGNGLDNSLINEQAVLVRSIQETVFPKLTNGDAALANRILHDVFPGIKASRGQLEQLHSEILLACERQYLVPQEPWVEKALQLYNIQNINHGVMIVGPSGSGKSSAFRVLFEALQKTDGIEGQLYIIEPKSVTKNNLYGSLDPTTREWTDGIFTQILRKIIDGSRGEGHRRHWIVFDGDVDPEWVENLNSVLDDNEMLTLPNGERLRLPSNVRIFFEVENLEKATPATISRCGMVWFSDELVTFDMLSTKYLNKLCSMPVDDDQDSELYNVTIEGVSTDAEVLPVQKDISDILGPLMKAGGILELAYNFAFTLKHVMEISKVQLLDNTFSMMNSVAKQVLSYNATHPDFPLTLEQLETFVTKAFYISMIWSLCGDCSIEERRKLGNFVSKRSILPLPSRVDNILDFDIDISSGAWIPWSSAVPQIDIDPHNLSRADVVIPTIDTLRHERMLLSWLSEHRSVILCGPPGSGKTMTLLFALRKMAEINLVPLNFSSETTPEFILRILELNCDYKKSSKGLVLSPKDPNSWLVVFCDEINLPRQDKYGTQRVISFLRQIIEQKGFWRADRSWVHVQKIQFVGACNPPTDPGRIPLSLRFLRHAPIMFVDYPERESLMTIYEALSRSCLKVHPNLRGYSEALTGAMVTFFINSKMRFTPAIHSHYVYSPRELTRWIRGIYEILQQSDFVSIEGLVRAWAHEGLCLFQDRLVDAEERDWADNELDRVAADHFPGIDLKTCLERPILYSNYLSKAYVSVNRDELYEFVNARLRVFYEEELDIQLVLFDKALEHILRIDRVLRQMQGHALIIGISGSGKTTLTRFVAWMNGITVYQPSMHNGYNASDFDDDLRIVLRRSGCKDEKMCLIIDEGDVKDPAFLERMNTLLANAEIPGLFENDEYVSLMSACKEATQREGLSLDSHDELYKWFTLQVMKNLHVVFTMNPPDGELSSKAETSPALFNRCVLDWYGDWDLQAVHQVAQEYTKSIDLDDISHVIPRGYTPILQTLAHPLSFRSIVLDAFAFIRQSMHSLQERDAARKERRVHVTPRQYLDFVSSFVSIYKEKLFQLEERQRHLVVGLDKLRDTAVQVEELRRSLAIKKAELERKTDQANQKLKKMVEDQREAENKRVSSMQIQASISKQKEEIEQRRKIVMADLEKVEPVVLEAQQSVRNINKQHLTEVRSMANPPNAVKMTMESVCILLGHKVDSWKSVQAVIRRDDFISSIVNYETTKMPSKNRDEVTVNYIDDPNFTFEIVNRASKACGPLLQWVAAQVTYSTILERVGPMRLEVQQLEESAEENEKSASEIDSMIKELEASIAIYKEEYAVLISETSSLRKEMDLVRDKVDRSVQILDNLTSERDRWGESRESFGNEMKTLVGNVLLSSAFMVYTGYYDQKTRLYLMETWKSYLKNAGISFSAVLSVPEYLTTADMRSEWIHCGLPSDNLCFENAAMLKRCRRYPLIIDPSGQAVEFILKEHRQKNISLTSFRDSSFLKTLESAIRFGNAVIIQDVEDFDTILNPILNNELRSSGGRTLCRLGNKDIDFSPSFTMFFATRNTSLVFTPDISSRTTFVNFTVTPASLKLQCLDQILKSERPDIDAKHRDLVKLQGEYQLRLHHLEKALLDALNDSKGNILDDDHVIGTLETLKKEAGEIVSKVQETEFIMDEVETVRSVYTTLASCCSSIYFAMEQLGTIQSIYQFSLEFFFSIFGAVLKENPALKSESNKKRRLEILELDIFKLSFVRVARSLRQEDILVFGMLICQIKLRGTPSEIREAEMEFLLAIGDGTGLQDNRDLQEVFGVLPGRLINELSGIPSLVCLKENAKERPELWKRLVFEPRPEEMMHLYAEFTKETDELLKQLHWMLVIKCVRPDRLMDAFSLLIQAVFKSSFAIYSTEDKLSNVADEVKGVTPIVLCSDVGYDTSSRVKALAESRGTTLLSVALGSKEGFQLAETAITNGTCTGAWVLLTNAHLSLAWLANLEKRLRSLKSGIQLKIFLTLEITDRLPNSLLRMSRILVFEPPVGIKASIVESLNSIPKPLISSGPLEKTRLFFMLSWLHSNILERRRYIPTGWTKKYDFNDSDFHIALHTIDAWLKSVTQGRTNISPSLIPWSALTKLIAENIYGGKVDVLEDQKVLSILVEEAFNRNVFEPGFTLVRESESQEKVQSPDGIHMNAFVEWVDKLKETLPPSWVGLASNLDNVLKHAKAKSILSKLRKLGEGLANSEDQNQQNSQANFTNVKKALNKWLSILHHNLPPSLDPQENRDPFSSFFNAELSVATSLLHDILADIKLLLEVIEGKEPQTNHSRQLILALRRDEVPKHWLRYKVPQAMSVNQFMEDLSKRLEQVATLCTMEDLNAARVWLGGLFSPDAFMTATRQTASQLHKVSLETLDLCISLDDTQHDANGVDVVSLKLHGAKWKNKKLELVDDVEPQILSAVKLRWVLKEKNGAVTGKAKNDTMLLPVYLNEERESILCYVSVKDERCNIIKKRGVAIIA